MTQMTPSSATSSQDAGNNPPTLPTWQFRGPKEWLIPDWPAPAHVRAVCTTRQGGVSQGAYVGMNLATHVGDVPQDVAINRRYFHKTLGAKPVYLDQVHGVDVLDLVRFAQNQLAGHVNATPPTADACVANQPELACTVMVADCLPVLFTTTWGDCVGAAHAGWRGLAAGVLERTVQSMRERMRCVPNSKVSSPHQGAANEIIAWLGPCIGPKSFLVGLDVPLAFDKAEKHRLNRELPGAPSLGDCFYPAAQGKFWADLPALARRRLALAGVNRVYGNNGADEWCTLKQTGRFFSYRRDQVCGRMVASVWLAG